MNIFWLMLVVLVDGIGFGIILPLLPIMAIIYGLTTLELGLVAGIFAFAQVIASPILGYISDRFGRKKVIVISLYCIALSYLMLAYSNTLLMIVLARFFAGIFAGNVSVVLASVADQTLIKSRSIAMGYIGGAYGFGFVLGPIIGGLLAGNDLYSTNLKFVLISATIFTLISAMLATFFVRETLRLKYKKGQGLEKLKQIILDFINNRDILYLALLSVLMWFSFSAIYLFLTTWGVFRYNLSPRDVGIVGTIFATVAAIVQIFSAYIIKGAKAIFLGFQVSGFATIALVAYPNFYQMIIILIILACGIGLLFPNFNSTISSQGTKNSKGFILGLSQSAGMLGQTLGPIVIGFFYYHLGANYAWVVVSVIFFLASIITLQFMFKDKS